MTNEELLRERVAKLKVQITHLNEKLDDTHQKVEEMHAILLQAKGARWVIVGMAGVAGLASGLLASSFHDPDIGVCHLERINAPTLEDRNDGGVSPPKHHLP